MKRESLQRRLFLLPAGTAFLLAGLTALTAAEQVRFWTSADGRRIEASLVATEDDSVVLRLVSGREARVELSRLSSEDREFLKEWEPPRARFSPAALPEETELPREIEVTGGPELYLTPNFAFETEEPVSKAFISEAAKVYEGTLAALSRLPHGLAFTAPEGTRHFRGRFLSENSFDQIARERMPSLPGQRIVGLYLGEEQSLFVPYSSLGAERLGSQLTLRKRSDTTTLVHEIVHQVMHRYLTVLPTWFSEGLAEYVSAVPYQSGRFEFRNAERGLRERLEEQYRLDGSEISGVIRPSEYFARVAGIYPRESSLSDAAARESTVPAVTDPDSWTGTVREYRDALLTVYFFMHLDDPARAGWPVGEYLYLTDAAMEDADRILVEIDQYEASRKAYNREVQEFNDSLEGFRKAAEAYNKKVEAYNAQVLRGLPPRDRIEVGEPPVEPSPPGLPKISETIESLTQEGQVIDLVALVQKNALPGLLRGRSPDAVDVAMREAFAQIGIEISYRP